MRHGLLAESTYECAARLKPWQDRSEMPTLSIVTHNNGQARQEKLEISLGLSDLFYVVWLLIPDAPGRNIRVLRRNVT